MINKKELFFRHLAQTSDAPLALEIERAEGVFLYTDKDGEIIDLIAGVSVNNVGHRNPEILAAIAKQLDKYMHVMVYGEVIQTPQVMLAKRLAEFLPPSLDTVYLVNSGSEANEGALKLAKKATGRGKIVSFENGYHGSTHGSLSIIGSDNYKKGYGPLLPNVDRAKFNDIDSLNVIDECTACVVVELVQGEGGVVPATKIFADALYKRCKETGALLIVDEVQTGFGRTGAMFAYEHYNIIPDIITLAKGLGGGMPIGAFVASGEIMGSLKSDPPLGHITTFGGHPVSAAAALASIEVVARPEILGIVKEKGERFVHNLLGHPAIMKIRQIGLFLACELTPKIKVHDFILKGLKNGILSDWFLFCDTAFRIAPPLIITDDEIDEASARIIKTLNQLL